MEKLNRELTLILIPNEASRPNSTEFLRTILERGIDISQMECFQNIGLGRILVTLDSKDATEKFYAEFSSLNKMYFDTEYSIDYVENVFPDPHIPQFITVTIFGAPHELDDKYILTKLQAYCDSPSINRGYIRDVGCHISNGVRYLKTGNIKKPIPTNIYVHGWRLGVKYEGQEASNQRCYNCQQYGHHAVNCPNERVEKVVSEKLKTIRYEKSPLSSPQPSSSNQEKNQMQTDTERQSEDVNMTEKVKNVEKNKIIAKKLVNKDENEKTLEKLVNKDKNEKNPEKLVNKDKNEKTLEKLVNKDKNVNMETIKTTKKGKNEKTVHVNKTQNEKKSDKVKETVTKEKNVNIGISNDVTQVKTLIDGQGMLIPTSNTGQFSYNCSNPSLNANYDSIDEVDSDGSYTSADETDITESEESALQRELSYQQEERRRNASTPNDCIEDERPPSALDIILNYSELSNISALQPALCGQEDTPYQETTESINNPRKRKEKSFLGNLWSKARKGVTGKNE